MVPDKLRTWPKNDTAYPPSFLRNLLTNNIKKIFSSTVFNKRRVIKSRRTRWAGHVARMGEGRDEYRILVGKETTWKTQA
jgi:hypothetical protein